MRDPHKYAPSGPWSLTSDGLTRIGVNYFGFQRVLSEPRINSPINYYLSQKLNSIALAAQPAIGDETVTLVPGHGVQIGEYVEFSQQTGLPHPLDAVRLYQAEAVDVVGDVITLEFPIDYSFIPAFTYGQRTMTEMNVDGSITPYAFTFAPIPGLDYYIKTGVLTMTHDSASALSTFGDILGGIPKGVYFSKVSPGLFQFTAFNARTNQNLAERSAFIEFVPRQAGTKYGTIWKWPISSDTNAGSSVLINSNGGDYITFVVRDDLTSLTSMRVNLIGIAINPIEISVVA